MRYYVECLKVRLHFGALIARVDHKVFEGDTLSNLCVQVRLHKFKIILIITFYKVINHQKWAVKF